MNLDPPFFILPSAALNMPSNCGKDNINSQLVIKSKAQLLQRSDIAHHLDDMSSHWRTFNHFALKQGFGGLIPLLTCLPFINLLEILNHLVCYHVLVLLLKLESHGGKHKTTDIKHVVHVFLKLVFVSPRGIRTWIIWNSFLNDIFLSFLLENYSQVVEPIKEINAIQFLLLKE
ncbi:hypothetical protein V6N13_059373 [Hibiscus sabdariffa]